MFQYKKNLHTTFKEYLTESINNYIKWGELSNSIKNDITENIYHNNKYIQNNYWSPEELKNVLNDTIKQPRFKIEYKNVDTLYQQLTQIGWSISELNVKKLINLLNKGVELDPIILNNDDLFDGGHRLTAYKRLRKKKIPTIDIGFMLNLDWKRWDNEQIDF